MRWKKSPTACCARRRCYSSPQFSVNVKRVEGHKLITPTFSFQSNADSPPVIVRAREAELKSDPGSGVLNVICRDGIIEMDGSSFEFSDTFEREIRLMDAGESRRRKPVADAAERAARAHGPPDRVDRATGTTAGGRRRLCPDRRRFPEAGWPGGRAAAEHVIASPLDLAPHAAPSRRAAGRTASVACVSRWSECRWPSCARHSDIWATFFVCFLPILLVYYPMMMFAVDRAKAGALPPATVWLGNIVLALWGGWLFRRVYRY